MLEYLSDSRKTMIHRVINIRILLLLVLYFSKCLKNSINKTSSIFSAPLINSEDVFKVRCVT
jgi:hypothetical protein